MWCCMLNFSLRQYSQTCVLRKVFLFPGTLNSGYIYMNIYIFLNTNFNAQFQIFVPQVVTSSRQVLCWSMMFWCKHTNNENTVVSNTQSLSKCVGYAQQPAQPCKSNFIFAFFLFFRGILIITSCHFEIKF